MCYLHILFPWFIKGGTKKCAKTGESLEEEDGEVKPCNAKGCGKAGESHKEEDGEDKPCSINRRRQSKLLGNLLEEIYLKFITLLIIPSSLIICMLLQVLILNQSKPRRQLTTKGFCIFSLCIFFSINSLIL